MLKTMKSGVEYSYPLDKNSKIKCEGYIGTYTIIDAATYENEVHVLLEHDFYGDETACLLAVLPLNCLRWYVVDKMNGNQIKLLFIRSHDILEESFDSIDIALSDHYGDVDEDVEFWTEEEINNMEV
jgi:hypothetical protein